MNRGKGAGGRVPMPTAPGVVLDNNIVRETLGDSVPRPTRADTVASQPAQAWSSRAAAAAGSVQAQPSGSATLPRQPFDAYVVLDFEATCEHGKRIPNPEVIEFPFVVINPDEARVVVEFQRYVRPVRRPTLSAFCQSLTGITQATTDGSSVFTDVFPEVLRFMEEELGLGDAPPRRSYCIVTCGDWDLKTMLPVQLQISGARPAPAGFQRWCNLKAFMRNLRPPLTANGHQPCLDDMPELLQAVGLPLRGRHHSGIDDCRNIAAVVVELMRRGYVIAPTYSLVEPLSAVRTWRCGDASSPSFVLTPWDSMRSSLAHPACGAEPPVGGSPPTTVGEPPEKLAREDASPQTAAKPGGRPSGKAADTAAPMRMPYVVIDSKRDAVRELQERGDAKQKLTPAQTKTASKALSWLLRHGADKAGVRISENAYCLLDDVLRYGTLASTHVTADQVASVVEGNEKKRFLLGYGVSDGRLYIAATQGHSLPDVEPDLALITPANAPDVVVHGTDKQAFERIRQCGYLSVMSRHHIHFAKGLPKDSHVISGMRASASVLLYLDVTRALADGVPLYESANGVILTPGVGGTGQLPLVYIKKAVDRASGQAYPL